MRATLLLADDDPGRRACVLAALGRSFLIREVPHLADLPALCAASSPDAIVIGAAARTSRAPFAAIDAIRRIDARVPVILLMEDGSEQLAITALRAGVRDYLPYPIVSEQLLASVGKCLAPDHRDGARSGSTVGAERVAKAAQPTLIGASGPMAEIRAYLTRVAAGEANVLITGETGTGKELAAALVHEHSARAARPFMPVVCAAIPDTLLESELFGYEKGAFTGAAAGRPGLLQAAHGGTVFLDEVGDVGLPAQAKLLRAIESRQVYRVGGRVPVPLDVRIVAATNRDLEAAVDQGTFRKDLYYRLNVARVHLPPLRERRSDIGAILDHYVAEFNARARADVALSPETRQALEAYDWPGNVRELKNLVECLFVCPRDASVRIDDLPVLFRRKLQGFCALDEPERRALLDALFAARWNKSRAAAMLRCSRMTLYRRMAKYSVIATDTPAARGGARKA